MRYYKVNSVEDARVMSEKLYSIMNPGSVESRYLFGWKTNGTLTIIEIDENMVCPVYVNDNFGQVLSDIAAILNGSLSPTEGTELRQYLETGEIVLGNLIPSGLQEITYQELIDNNIINLNNNGIIQ